MGIDQIYAEKKIANEPALEKKSALAASRERIAAASKLFVENFDESGRPISKKGQKLFQEYNYYSPSVSIPMYLINWIRKWFGDHTKTPKCFVCFDPILKDKVTIEKEGIHTLRFHKDCADGAYKILFNKKK